MAESVVGEAVVGAESTGSPGAKRQYFPDTKSWIRREASEEEIRDHVMEVYYEPLLIYFKGHSGRTLGEPEEIVHGFIADRFARGDYFSEWRKSGKRLRRWLMNGLSFYIQECRHAVRRQGRFVPLNSNDGAALERRDEGAYDREIARRIARLLILKTKELCLREGYRQHWEVFEKHFLEGLQYPEFAAELGVTPERAAVLIRTPKRRVAKVLRELMQREELDANQLEVEIDQLTQALERGERSAP